MVLRQYEVETDRGLGIPELVLVKELKSCYLKDRVDSPDLVVSLMKEVYRLDVMAEEWLYMLAVNTKTNVLGIFMVAKGFLSRTVVEPRSIFCRALLIGAANFILVHNHPSGSVEPSKEDDDVTELLYAIGSLMEVSLLDHIIVGKSGYYSYREAGKICLREEVRRQIIEGCV